MSIDTVIHAVSLLAAGVLAYIALYIRSTVQQSSEKAEARYRELVRAELAIELGKFGERFFEKIAEQFVRSAKSTFTGAEIERRLEQVEDGQRQQEDYANRRRHEESNRTTALIGAVDEQVEALRLRVLILERLTQLPTGGKL